MDKPTFSKAHTLQTKASTEEMQKAGSRDPAFCRMDF
jgi:hypothetical protein